MLECISSGSSGLLGDGCCTGLEIGSDECSVVMELYAKDSYTD